MIIWFFSFFGYISFIEELLELPGAESEPQLEPDLEPDLELECGLLEPETEQDLEPDLGPEPESELPG